MAGRYYWLKERDNPQFDKPYFVAYGNITASEAKTMESSLYGYNTMHKFKSKTDYESKIEELRKDGFSVNT